MPTCFAKSTAITAVLVMSFCVKMFRTQGDENDGEWVQLCTLTSNGSSRLNVTMPCGIYVKNDEPENGVETSAKDSAKEPSAVMLEKNGTTSDVRDDGDIGNDRTNEKIDNDFRLESIVNEDYPERIAESDYVFERRDKVTVETAEDDDNADDYAGDSEQEEHEHRQQNTVNKVMLTYLLDAKNQLYNKILNLLNMLKNAFFNARLNRRSRRNSIERRIKFSANEKPVEDIKKHSISSTIMEPTFERSMMTMSFLVFGLFIIQVVQRLMQTMQHFGEVKSMVNSVNDYLPKVSF